MTQRAEKYSLAVFAPTVNLIVPTPARRQRAFRRVESQLARHTARRRNDVYLLVAVVLTSERDPLAVRRKPGKDFNAWMRRQPNRGSAGSRRGPNVSAVGEGHPLPMNVGKAQQFGLAKGRTEGE